MMMMFKKQIPSAQDDPSNHLRMLSWNGINCSLHNIYSYILYYRFVDSILLKRINHDHLHSVIQFALDITELCNLTKRTKHMFFCIHPKNKQKTNLPPPQVEAQSLSRTDFVSKTGFQCPLQKPRLGVSSSLK